MSATSASLRSLKAATVRLSSSQWMIGGQCRKNLTVKTMSTSAFVSSFTVKRLSGSASTLRRAAAPATTTATSPTRRWLASLPGGIATSTSEFVPKPPEKLTTDMAEGILEATQFYIRYGISHQRLRQLATARGDDNKDMPVIDKWQQMMEIYITTQLHVIAGIGYPPSQEGLALYAQHLQQCIMNDADETMKQLFIEVRRDTWREIVATVFDVNVSDLPVLSIVEARTLMHTVSSKMVHPDTLLAIQTATAKIVNDDLAVEIQQKHAALQHILIEHVYLGDSPNSLVEQSGFGPGPLGYAKLQCALSDHEGDPLMADYAASAMMKILAAANIDIDSIQGPGLGAQAV